MQARAATRQARTHLCRHSSLCLSQTSGLTIAKEIRYPYLSSSVRGLVYTYDNEILPSFVRTFSSPSDSSNTNANTIQITETKSSSESSSSSSPSTTVASESAAEQELLTKPNTGGGPNLKHKSNQQIAEEEIHSLNSHVQTHYHHANYTEALSTSQEALSASLSLFGQSHPSTAAAHNNVGLMHKMLGEFDQAREHYHKALDVYGAIVGKDHASYAAALSNLANLDRSQSVLDEELGALERLQMKERAVEYLEEALEIRKVELGEEHVHTVSGRSNLGSALASLVLQAEFVKLENWNKDKGEDDDEDAVDGKGAVTGNKMTRWTRQKWDMAEKHLRDALKTAVRNPRGERVAPLSNGGEDGSDNGTAPAKRDRTKSKKERRKEAKGRKRKQKAAIPAGTVQSDVGDASIQTLSAAAAAQNLAVFLKSRADLLSKAAESGYHSIAAIHNRDDDDNDDEFNGGMSLDREDMYAEARRLYLGAMHVRVTLRGEYHPDTVATKFSLAELMAVLGDEEGANALRKEILDAYQVEERDDTGHDDNETSKSKSK